MYFSQKYLSRDMIKLKIIVEMETMAVVVTLSVPIIKEWRNSTVSYTLLVLHMNLCVS